MIRVMQIDENSVEEIELMTFSVADILESRFETKDDYVPDPHNEFDESAIDVRSGDVEFVTVYLNHANGLSTMFVGKREDWKPE